MIRNQTNATAAAGSTSSGAASRGRLLASVSSIIVLAALASPAAQAAPVLPTGGQFVAGAGGIAAAGASALQINQSSARGIIDWRSFSIGAGGAVAINNGSGVTLNRVTGGQLSLIQGSLTATGSLYLVNPQGVVIGPGGQVLSGGGVVLSSRNIANDAFMAGGAMTASGTSIGDVTNKGTVLARTGDVVIIGHSVSNTGSILAPGGTATLAAADSVVLSSVGGASGVIVASDPSATGDVTEAGRVQAAAAALTAAGGNVYSLAGSSGVIQATGSATIAGHAYLTASNGVVSVAGAVAAKNADGSGGDIVVSGKTVNVAGSALLDARGTSGGQVLVGVSAPQTNVADTTTIADGARILASGPAGGGHIETSGHTLNMSAVSVDAGQGGSWLIDPTDLTIDSSLTGAIVTSLNTGMAVAETATGNVTLAAGAPITWTNAAGALTFTAGSNLSIQSAINGAGAFTATAGGSVTVGAAVSASTVSMRANGGNLSITGGSVTGTAAGAGTAVTLATTHNFINSAGAGAVAATTGNWRVYSTNPALDTTGGLSPGFYQYNAAIGATALGTGNGLLYSIAPTVNYSVIGSVTKVYDSLTSATGLTSANISATGLINGDIASPTGGTGTYSQADVGNSLTVTIAGISVLHGSAPVFGYTLGTVQNQGVIGSITPKSLGVTLGGSLDKIYDGTNVAELTSANFTVTGTVGGQSITVVPGPTAATYATTEASPTPQTVTVALTNTSYSAGAGTKLTNYTLPLAPTAGATTGTIFQAPLEVLGIQANDKQYDTTSAATLNLTGAHTFGAVAADAAGLTLVTSGATASFAAGPNVGSGLTVNASGFTVTGAKAADYNVFVPTGSLKASITAAPLTITGVTAVNKSYDATTNATLTGTAHLSGLFGSDASGVALTTTTAGTFSQANVATGLTVTTSGFSIAGAASGNYSLVQPTGLTADITPALLTVTLGGTTAKTYDGGVAASVNPANYTVTGWQGTEGGSIDQTSSAVYAGANAGSPQVTATLEVSDFAPHAGTSLSNYTTAATGPQTLHDVITGAGLINPAPLTIGIIGNPTKVFVSGDASATLTPANFAVQGYVGAESATINATNGTYASDNAGVEAVSINLTSGNFVSPQNGFLASNYSFNNPITGFGTITPAALGIGIVASLTGNPSKIYDGTNILSGLTSANFVLTGWTGADIGETDVQVTKTTGTYAGVNVGSQPITVTLNNAAGTATLRGDFTSITTDLTNYTLPSVAFGMGTITQKVLTAGIINNPTKTYNGTADATLATSNFTLSGLVTGENISVTQQAGTYASVNAGNPVVTANIPVSDLVSGTNTNTGQPTLLSNYVLPTTATTVGFGAGTGTINQAPLVVLNAFGIGKTYDGTTAATLNVGGDSLFGVVSTDSITLNSPTTGAFAGKDVANGLAVTPTTPFSLTANGGTLLSNYVLTQPTLTANITPATLTVTTASASSKNYDGGTVAAITASGLTGVFTSTGAPLPDDVTLVTAGGTGNFSQSDVGNGLSVTASGFALAGSLATDYVLTQPQGLTANIVPAPITATIVHSTGNPNDLTKTYDGTTTVALGAANYVLSGWASGQGGDVTVAQAASSQYASSDASSAVTITANLEIPDFNVATGSNPTKLSNYALPTLATGVNVGTINKAPLIAQIVNDPTKVYDATTGTGATNTNTGLQSSNYKLLGFVGNDGATVSQNTGTFSNSGNAGIDVITAALTAGDFTATGGANLNNYLLPTTAVGGGTVTPFALTITGAAALSKVYDTTTTAQVTAGTANIFGADAGNVTINAGTGVFASKDVANGIAVTASGYTLSGSAAGNYTLTQPVGLTANITPAPLTVKVTKTYDGTDSAAFNAAGGTSYSVQGVLGGDSVSLGSTAGITGNYDAGANVNAVTANGAISNGAGAVLAAGGQSIDYAITTYTGVINPLQLTISGAVAQNKVYNGNTAAMIDNTNTTLNGRLAGDVASIGLTDTNVGVFASKDAADNIAVTTTGYSLTGNTNGDYSLRQPTGLQANITPATLAVSLASVTKVYDGTTALPTPSGTNYVLNGIIGSDAVNVSAAVGSYNSVHAATGIGVNISSLTLGGAQSGDYTVAAVPANAAIGIIIAAPLTVSIVGAPAKQYDGTTAATLTGSNYSITGLQQNDTATVNADALLLTGATYNNKNVASATTLTVNGVSASEINFGSALSTDYTVTTTATGAGSITPITLGVTLANQTKVYDAGTGAVIANGDYSVTNTLTGDNVSINQTVGTYASANVLGANLSTVTANLGSGNIVGSGTYVAGNYVLPTSVTNTTSTITPVTLTAVLAPQTKTYDGNTSDTGLTPGSYTVGNLVNGQTVSIDQTTGAYNDPNVVGATSVTAALTSSNFAGGNGFIATNYVLPTFATGMGTITAKTITAAIIGDPTKVYNNNTGSVLTGANYALTGFIGAQGATVNQTVGTYNFKDVLTGNTVTASLAPGNFTLTNGAISTNYVLPTTASGAATITPAPLTVTGLSVFNKPYDGTTAATLDTSHAGVLAGVLGSDNVTLATGPNSAQFVSPNAANGVSVNLSGGSIGGAQASDYFLIQNGLLNANITPLTISAAIIGTPTKTYDATTGAVLTGADYALTGFLAGQGAGVTQTVGTYASPNAGSEGVTASLSGGNFAANGGTLLSNYILPTSAAGVGLINQALLTAAIIGTPTKTADGTTVATLTGANFQLTGFVAGQGAGITQTAGTYAAPGSGPEGVTASLAGSDFSAGVGTLLSNYRLPTSATGPGLITAALAIAPAIPVGASVLDTINTLLGFSGPETLDQTHLATVASFDIADVRTYIPYPAPGALSSWRNNGWGTLPIVIDDTTDYTRSADEDGNVAIQSGAPVINSTEQVMLSGVKNKRWRITIPKFTVGPSLGLLQTTPPVVAR